MYSTVPSSALEKGPSELEESEEEGAASLCKDWRLEPSQNLVIGGKEERLTLSGGGLPEEHWKDPRRSAWSLPLLQEDLGFLLKEEGRKCCS
jgi:hypothetical protein